MPIFRYSAINDDGKKFQGELIAANEFDLEERLKPMHLTLIDFKKVGSRGGLLGKRVKIKDMIILCLHLEQLDRAGVPLLDSLADVRDSTDSPTLKNIMTDIYETVKNGELLSEALKKHPTIFNNVFTGLIKTGERTGRLSEAFYQISKHIKWVSDLRRKVKKALRYPIALTMVITGVIAILMTQVVPKLVDFLLAQGFNLPGHTKALIAFSKFFGDYWYLIISFPVILVVSIRIAYRFSKTFAYNFDALMLKIPFIGSTIRKIDLSRFTHFFSVMFKSGVDILDSLETARSVVNNLVIVEAVDTIRKLVSEGNTLTNSLRMSGQFPNLVVRMFKVGEDSGNMNDALENVNFFYDREVNDAVDTMIGLIQPTLTVFLGAMIVWIMAAVFGPLYESFSKIKF